MSQPDPQNPFASPQAVPAAAPLVMPALEAVKGIEYLRMYSYVFENPNWATNILFGALCCLIPVIGPLLMLGYQFEVIEGLLYSRGRRYPNFDFNRFADYLLRGLWPFLVQLITSLVLVPVMMIFIFVPMMCMFGIAGLAGEDGAGIVLLIGYPLWMVFIVLVSILPVMCYLPMMLRAGLAQDLGEGFSFNWAMDFFKRTWLEMLLGLLFWVISVIVLEIVGLMVFCVGILAVLPLMFLAQAHLMYQLYLLYLTRGGSASPMKPPSPHLVGP